MKRTTDYTKKTKADLEKKVAELRSAGQGITFKLASNQLKHVREARVLKREIARVLTASRTAK